MIEVRIGELDRSPQQKENYNAITAMNQWLMQKDKIVVFKDVWLHARDISSPMMVHDIATTIIGCEGLIPILRKVRNNDPSFIYLLEWTMENVYIKGLEMTNKIVKTNYAMKVDLTPRPLPTPITLRLSPARVPI